MDAARYLVEAHLREERSVAELARGPTYFNAAET